MGKNLYRKVFERHAVRKLASGKTQLFIDLHLMHEVTSPQAFTMLRDRGLKAARPGRTFATVDHIIPTDPGWKRPLADAVAEEMFTAIERNTREFDLLFFGPESGGQGVIHVMAPEQGLVHPGMTVACGDSHTATHGAFGALAFGIGTSQVRDVLATQTMAVDELKVRRIVLAGRPGKGVQAKDLALFVIRTLGVEGGVGFAYEFAGEAVSAMGMEERLTLCNMAIEGGARVGYVNPDQATFDYLRGRPHAPSGAAWERAVAYWRGVASDADATWDDVRTLDASAIEPQVTWGITPAQCLGVSERIPALAAFAEKDRVVAREAFAYMGVEPGQAVKGLPVDVCFIGSCTNGRLSDLQEAARVLAGRRVKPGVRALAVPGSQIVKREAESLGLDRIFRDAGFEWREAGCSMCLAMNADRLKGAQRSASTSNRNFKGRQGSPEGRTLLMSPVMVAAAAVSGAVADAREVFSL